MVKRLVTFDHFWHCHYVTLLFTLQDCSRLIICKGFLADGTVFDSNEGKDPIRLGCTTETKTDLYKDISLKGSCTYYVITIYPPEMIFYQLIEI